MEGLSADMIEEILVRLPVKSVLRFKCVCRSWRALIQSWSFIRRHYCHDSNQERLFLEWGEYVEGRFEEVDYNPLSLDYFGNNNRGPFIGSVMGLLCKLSYSGDIVLLNPATHKVKRVPPLPLITCYTAYRLCFGFGVESSSGDYKIVVFCRSSESAWVYNSISDCWKQIEVVFSSEIKSVNWVLNAKFWNGVYYWVFMLMDREATRIVAFDMVTEKFREFEAPGNVHAIAAYGDSIGVMSRQGDYMIWMMEKGGVWSECWRFRANPERLLGMCVWKGEALFWNYIDGTGSVVVVDVTTQKVRILGTRNGNPQQYLRFQHHLCCYKESLLSIKGEQSSLWARYGKRKRHCLENGFGYGFEP